MLSGLRLEHGLLYRPTQIDNFEIQLSPCLFPVAKSMAIVYLFLW